MRLLAGAGTGQSDPLLAPYLSAPEAQAQEVLGELITFHVRPLIRGILRGAGGCGGSEIGDLEGEVVVRLVERLRRLRIEALDENRDSIRDLRGYVAVATYNALSEHKNRRSAPSCDSPDERLLRLPDPAPDAASILERRTYLARLWEEIRKLPVRQAAALLLNLRDGQRQNAVGLLPLTGIASLRDIARAIGVPAVQLAALWNRLPLEDNEIAHLLGTSRQQVINLRKSARERLARRMRLH